MRTSAVQPMAAATPEATSPMRRFIIARISPFAVRSVPRSVTLSQMMLPAVPPEIMPRLSTALASGETLRETSVCRLVITCAAQTIASAPLSGYAPWLERPRIVSSTSSVEAFSVPARVSITPTGRYGCTCRPYTRSTCGFSITPRCTIGSAPPSVSSAG